MADSKDVNPKVFDVAKPGTTDPPIGGKPMVIGHSFMRNDPTLTAPEITPSVTPDTTKSPEAADIKVPSKKVVIQPISANKTIEEQVEKPKTTMAEDAVKQSTSSAVDADSTSDNLNATITTIGSEAIKDTNKEPEGASQSDSDAEPDVSEKLPEEHVSTVEERAQVVNDLISSKKYFIPIKEQSHRGQGTNSWVAILIGMTLLIIGILVAIDSGLLDIGVELPFNIL